jgi:hypothetical protein
MKITGVRVLPGLTLQFQTLCTIQPFNSSKATNLSLLYRPILHKLPASVQHMVMSVFLGMCEIPPSWVVIGTKTPRTSLTSSLAKQKDLY